MRWFLSGKYSVWITLYLNISSAINKTEENVEPFVICVCCHLLSDTKGPVKHCYFSFLCGLKQSFSYCFVIVLFRHCEEMYRKGANCKSNAVRLV